MLPNKLKNRFSLKLLGFYTMLFITTAPLLLRRIHANDVWKALYSGRYLALFHKFPHHSTFSFSPVKEIVTRDPFNWLGNLFFVGIYKIGGFFGVQGLRILFTLVVIVLLHSLINFKFSFLDLLLFVLFILAINQKLLLRTAIFSAPFTVFFLVIWIKNVRSESDYLLFLLPVLFLFWANMHGSYVIGLGFFILLIIGQVLKRVFHSTQTNLSNIDFSNLLIVLLLILVIVTYVKPYPDYQAYNLLTGPLDRLINFKTSNLEMYYARLNNSGSFSFDTVQNFFLKNKGFQAKEYDSPFSQSSLLFVRSSFLMLILFTMLFATFGIGWTYIPLLMGSTLLGLLFLRGVAYIPLVWLPIYLNYRRNGDFHPLTEHKFTKLISLYSLIFFSSLFLTISSFSLSLVTNNHYHSVGIGTSNKTSSKFAEFVLKKYPNTQIANSLNVGAFLIWEWWPYKKVLIDTKTSAYQNEFWTKIQKKGLLTWFQRKNINYFLIEEENAQVPPLLRISNWEPFLKKREMILFKKNNSAD